MKPVAFYHVAGLNHWREIVAEQLGLLGRVGFPGKVHCGFIGGPYEDGFIAHVAAAAGLEIEIRHWGGDMGQFEFPTQQWMHEVAGTLPPETPMLYFHGKGVSRNCWQWTMWRWIMNAYCLAEWPAAIKALGDGYNCAGVSWSRHPAMPAPHFPGTFWWAGAGFVAHLTPVDEYIRQFEEWRHRYCKAKFVGKRHAAESWFNSRVDAVPKIFLGEGARFWDHGWWTHPNNDQWSWIAYKNGR